MPQKTYMYDTQWNQLINAINTGDSSAVVSALNTIKNSLDNITNAISSQSITVDLSNINSDNVFNLSDIQGSSLTNALNILNSDFNDIPKLIIGTLDNNKSVTLVPQSGSHLLIISRSNNNIYCGIVFDYWGNNIKTVFGNLPSNLTVNKNVSSNNISITNNLGYAIAYTLI